MVDTPRLMGTIMSSRGSRATQKAYGTWNSHITVDLLSKQVAAFEDVLVDSSTSEIYHVERRPSEGRNVLVKTKSSEEVAPGSNVRSIVNGYGNAPAVARHGTVYYTNLADFRIYKVDSSGSSAVTNNQATTRFGDMCIHPTRSTLLVSVFEDHTNPVASGVVNSLATIDAPSGEVSVIVKGCDFYGSPTFSPSGEKLAWIQWNHPNMPWQATQLVIGDVSLEGSTIKIICQTLIVGGAWNTVSLQPQWLTNDALLFIHDESGWSQPWVHHASSGTRPILKEVIREEFTEPLWFLGISTYAILDDDRIMCTAVKNGFAALYTISLTSGTATPLKTPYVEIVQLRRAGPNSVVFAGVQTDHAQALVLLTITSSGIDIEVLSASADAPIQSEFVSQPRALVLEDKDGPLHALYYPPTNPNFVGLPGELPPMIVSAHGGPTARTGPGFMWARLLYTSRGFAWVDIMYRGSTGYGRKYMELLNEKWGEKDTQDCMEAARQISAQALADPKRILIRGGSAGGYVVLQSLVTYPEFYAAGASHFGIGDLKRLHETTHKFQSHYIPGLMGGTPDEVPDTYRKRSPLYHAENIVSPLLLLHGKLDLQVPIEQTESIINAIEAAGGRVEHQFFDDEGHGFRKSENIKIQYERELGFFQDVLGLKPQK